jgi:hypothetical protein
MRRWCPERAPGGSTHSRAERALGKKVLEIEIIQAARDEAKTGRPLRGVQAVIGLKLERIVPPPQLLQSVQPMQRAGRRESLVV